MNTGDNYNGNIIADQLKDRRLMMGTILFRIYRNEIILCDVFRSINRIETPCIIEILI